MTLTDISTFGGSKYDLQLPDLPEEYLDITVIDNEEEDIEEIIESYPLAVSGVTTEKILNSKKLTNGEDVREIYSLELSNTFSLFKPGDTIGILTQNREDDVNKFFNHLGIIHLAGKKCKIIEKSPIVKRNPLKLAFLNKITTLKYLVTFCLDLQCIPKKLLIRILAEFTKDLEEKRYLEELCSKERSDLYTKQILEANKTFLDLLLKFPSCQPPIVRLIENLPRLLPRPYSIASSPLTSTNKIKIFFSVVKNENKEGLCTGMLKNMISRVWEEELRVKMFFRKCNGFNLPESDVPLILVGPGTGIAPFMGFLQHRKMQGRKAKICLFYGCRHKMKDYLFEKELQEFLDCGVLTNLLVAFSRDGSAEAKYVQDNIRKLGKEICHLILEEHAMVYVCGDAKNMRKDIQNAFMEVLQTYKGISSKEATELIKKLQKEKRYLQDIWI